MKKLALFLFLLPLMVNAQEDSVYIVVEKMPEFPGGEKAMFEYLNDNLSFDSCKFTINSPSLYPISFIVEKDGSLSNIKVEENKFFKSPDYCQQPLNVIYKMPNWKPGEQEGKVVRVKILIPLRIHFD